MGAESPAIEGYASLPRGRGPDRRRLAGRWTRIREDGRSLTVRGFVTAETPGGRAALDLIGSDRLSGLSIGFFAQDWSPGVTRGRELREIDLREGSLVATPMRESARFAAVGGPPALAAKRAA